MPAIGEAESGRACKTDPAFFYYRPDPQSMTKASLAWAEAGSSAISYCAKSGSCLFLWYARAAFLVVFPGVLSPILSFPDPQQLPSLCFGPSPASLNQLIESFNNELRHGIPGVADGIEPNCRPDT